MPGNRRQQDILDKYGVLEQDIGAYRQDRQNNVGAAGGSVSYQRQRDIMKKYGVTDEDTAQFRRTVPANGGTSNSSWTGTVWEMARDYGSGFDSLGTPESRAAGVLTPQQADFMKETYAKGLPVRQAKEAARQQWAQQREQDSAETVNHDQVQGWKRTQMYQAENYTLQTEAEARYARAHNTYMDAQNAMSHVGPGMSGDVVEARYRAQQDALTELNAARQALIDAGGDPNKVTPGLGTRILRTVTGGAKGWVGSIASALGAAGDAEVTVKNYNDLYIQALTKAAAEGREVTPEEMAELYDQAHKSAVDNSGIYPVADEISASAQEDLDLAQRGAGIVGRLAVNAGANAVQMAMDKVAGPLSMFPMVIRSFGGAAQEARLEGKNYAEQVGLGMASAVTEWATEKMFGGNPVYDTDVGLVNKLISNAANKISPEAAKKIMAVLSSTAAETLNEGWEEVLSGLAEPLWKMIVSGEAYQVNEQELIEDWIVGVLLGMVGQGTEAGIQAAAQARAEQAEMRRIYEALGLEAPETQTAAPKGAAESTMINDDPADHTRSEQRVIEEYKDSADPKLVSFIERVRNLQNQDYKNGIRQTISTETDKAAKKAAELTGVDTTGYTTIINGSSIQHIDNRHGVNGTADHSMADIQDFSRIGFVLDNFTDARTIPISELDIETAKLTKAWKNSNNTPAPLVQFSMPVNGVYYVVEAVPSSKAHVMAVISTYISSGGSKKASTLNQVLNMPEAPTRSSTSETMLELLGADNRSLLQKGSAVNSAASDYDLLSSAFPKREADYYAVFGLDKPAEKSNEKTATTPTQSDELHQTALTQEEKKFIIQKTGWSPVIVDHISSIPEFKIYQNAGLYEGRINGRPCLLKTSLDNTSLENKMRIRFRLSPIDPATGEAVVLHHLGQKMDAPFVELCLKSEHSDGNHHILHPYRSSSWRNIPGAKSRFAKQRQDHWNERIKGADQK